jgi:hypothetical protein
MLGASAQWLLLVLYISKYSGNGQHTMMVNMLHVSVQFFSTLVKTC